MATEEEVASEDRPKVYLETSVRPSSPRVVIWRTSAMKDNEIITGIREARHAFAAQHGFDPRKISEAAMKIALGYGFKTAVISANPNFHYPTATAAAV